ncbi:hypothetical protein OF83DRAFT_756312 [Amylostereum chailletii]|nr:hypothetical protein OF83DRAFT_756312 [Amylostereum chailletii]
MMEASTEVTEEHETPSQGFDAVPPIERMPPELLHETFSYLTALELERLRSYDDETRPLPLPCGIILARVCTRWREIVCHDKALWTSIPLYFRPELQWTEKALQLSDPLPIDIFVHDVKSWRNVLPALDQLARARTISLYGIHLTPLSKADLPDMLPPDVLSGDAPQLKELNLTNVVMRANWTHSFPVLTEFEARNSLLWTTPKEMHAALSLMPQLRHLSLGQNDCLDFRWFDLPENVLHLEHLSSLSLEGDADDMADFLSCVSFPSGASLEIIIVNSPPNEKLGFALAAHFAPLSAVPGQLPVMHATATDSSLDIHIEYANLNPAYTFPDYIAIYIEYDDPDMEGYYVCFMIEHLLPSLPGHGGASALLLSRAEDCGDIIAREWLDPFLKLTGVQKLSVAGRAVYDLADRWSKERCDSRIFYSSPPPFQRCWLSHRDGLWCHRGGAQV